jgi:cytidyltransferase-like protein
MSSKIIDNLVSSAKNGNAEAFGELYEIYSKDMFRFAYYYLGSYATAEDCVSECVCLAFQKIGSLRKSSSFKSWLFKILHNCCNSALREKIQNEQTCFCSKERTMSKAIYPGSFDPMTCGHLDVIRRSADIFDELTICVLNNVNKSALFSVEERVNILKEATKELPNVKVESFSGLLIDYAKSKDKTVTLVLSDG